jgi:hypothetical protein
MVVHEQETVHALLFLDGPKVLRAQGNGSTIVAEHLALRVPRIVVPFVSDVAAPPASGSMRHAAFQPNAGILHDA